MYIVHEEGPCREETQLKPPSKKVKILPPKKASRSSPRISCSIFRHDNDQFSSCLPFDSIAEQARQRVGTFPGYAGEYLLPWGRNTILYCQDLPWGRNTIAKTCHHEYIRNVYRNVYFRQVTDVSEYLHILSEKYSKFPRYNMKCSGKHDLYCMKYFA